MNQLTLDQLAEQSPVATQELIRLRAKLAAMESQEPAICKTEYVPISADMKSVFIDGFGLLPIKYPEQDDKPAIELDQYDAGHLNDYGGGNVGWWHDYIRAELDRAHDHYAQQFITPADKPAGRITEQDVREIANHIFGYVGISYLTAAFENWFGKFGGRELINKLNADREQVSDVTHAVAVPDSLISDIEFVCNAIQNETAMQVCCGRPGQECCGSPEADWPSWATEAMTKLASSRELLLASSPSHSQQSSQGTTSAASREDEMVVIECDSAGTPTVWCDPEIVDLVTALNKAGIRTVASCSGHGYRPGNIALADGRELFIARTFEEAREIDQLFLTDINGNRCPSHDSEQGGES